MFNREKIRKIFAVYFLSIFLFAQIFGFLFYPATVKAQGMPVIDAQMFQNVTSDKILKQVKDALLSSAMNALMKGISYFLRKLAYDGAMYLASGGKGQGALAFKNGFGDYLKDVAGDSAASAVDQIGKPFGLNLCSTPDLKLQSFIQVGLRDVYKDPLKSMGVSTDLSKMTQNQKDGVGGTAEASQGMGPQPDCSLQNMKNSWSADAFEEKYGPGGSKMVDQMFGSAVRTGGDDFSIALGAQAQIDRIQTQKVIGSQSERAEGQGWKAVKGLVSNEIKTPASTPKLESEAVSGKQQSQLTNQQVAGMYGQQGIQTVFSALSTFVSTLTGQLLKKLLTGGFFDDGGGKTPADTSVSSFYGQYLTESRSSAQSAFSFLLTGVPKKDNSAYTNTLLGELASCPDGNPGLNNCVIDEDFQTLLSRTIGGESITIRQALTEKLLHDWPLIPPTRVENSQKDCYDGRYCYSNLQKLRKVRIIPLGFEVAAKKADPNNLEQWTLQKIVDNFYNTSTPYYHLIDPNWVIKLPEIKCEAKVFSQQLISADSPDRIEQCVDMSTCIESDTAGGCSSKVFGYCTREKNVWRFGGDSCKDYYDTCKTFTSAGDGKEYSYLSRTVDFGECDDKSLGCQIYSTEQKNFGVGDVWVPSTEAAGVSYKIVGRNQTISFNDKIQKCSVDTADGCTEFYSPEDQNNNTFLKKAPDYLGCYDTDLSTKEVIDWPQTKIDLAKLTKNEKCNAYAQVCLPEEKGCDSYTPVEGAGMSLSGIVGANGCPSQCVGYSTYKQEVTNFVPEQYPLYFRSADATGGGAICNESVMGCEEFTNIDEAAKGGESLEYYTFLRTCERPTDTNQKVYYSWEGSATEGYVLKTHTLKPIGSDTKELIGLVTSDSDMATQIGREFVINSPQYAENTKAKLEENYSSCNAQIYNESIKNPEVQNTESPNCVALYDKGGNIFYRLLDQTITVSEECHPMRKTNTLLEKATYLDSKGQNTCEKFGGFWTDGPDADTTPDHCERCYMGGQYQAGSCIYWTISKPGESSSCQKQNVGCKKYTGNLSGNMQKVFEIENFENGIADGDWSSEGGAAPVVSLESTKAGEHSLKINSNIVRKKLPAGTIANGSWYTVSFWSRGNTQKLRLTLEQGDVVNSFNMDKLSRAEFLPTIGADWKPYKFGAIQFTGDTNQDAYLVIERFGVAGETPREYFVDNLSLERIQDVEYLIQDSWKREVEYNGQRYMADVDLACDDVPNDKYPGAMLGCSEYKNSKNEVVPLVGFERLCRDEAVGCEELVNTYNSTDINTTTYNVLCTRKNADGSPNKDGGECIVSDPRDGSAFARCDVLKFKSSCFIKEKIIIPTGYSVFDLDSASSSVDVVTSTVIVPADSAPIYLTNRQTDFGCKEADKGCQMMALETQIYPSYVSSSFTFDKQYILNNPDNYINGDNGFLCRQDLVGCQKYSYQANDYYFKDPNIGNKLCYYKPKTSDTAPYGWFLKDIGRCYDGTNTSTLVTPSRYCKQDADCGKNGAGADNVCKGQNEIACYNDNIEIGGARGMWSNGTPSYTGMVGICDSAANSCTKIVDPTDVENPYYVIYNDKLEEGVDECYGKVSRKEGCALFDVPERSTKLYNASASYTSSENQKDILVVPSKTGTLDSNVILKVTRDRQCGEWLSCQSSVDLHEDDNQTRKVCTSFGVCTKLDESGNCEEWADRSGEPKLTADEYVNRTTTWSGSEYSGYSLLDKYHPGTIKRIMDNGLPYLASLLSGDTACNSYASTASCRNGWGKCYHGYCAVPIGASEVSTFSSSGISPLESLYTVPVCKTFPELTSPFYVADNVVRKVAKTGVDETSGTRYDFVRNDNLYKNANICQSGTDCSCEYKKVTYKNGSVVDYWPIETSDEEIPLGICNDEGEMKDKPCKYDSDCSTPGRCDSNRKCIGGARSGLACSSNEDCAEKIVVDGKCSQRKDITQSIGQKSFCLEEDKSRPLGRFEGNDFACLTWLPMDTSVTNYDIYNLDKNAGYNPSVDGVSKGSDSTFGKVYCAQSTGGNSYTYQNHWMLDQFKPNNWENFRTIGHYGKFSNDVDFALVNPYYQIIYGIQQYYNPKDLIHVVYSYIQYYNWFARYGNGSLDANINITSEQKYGDGRNNLVIYTANPYYWLKAWNLHNNSAYNWSTDNWTNMDPLSTCNGGPCVSSDFVSSVANSAGNFEVGGDFYLDQMSKMIFNQTLIYDDLGDSGLSDYEDSEPFYFSDIVIDFDLLNKVLTDPKSRDWEKLGYGAAGHLFKGGEGSGTVIGSWLMYEGEKANANFGKAGGDFDKQKIFIFGGDIQQGASMPRDGAAKRYGVLVVFDDDGNRDDYDKRVKKTMTWALVGDEEATKDVPTIFALQKWVEFDGNGKLIHDWVWSSHDDDDGMAEYDNLVTTVGPAMAVSLSLKPRCVDFRLAHQDGNPGETLNYAWTNRVWQYAKQSPVYKKSSGVFSYILSDLSSRMSISRNDLEQLQYKNSVFPPFGSLSLDWGSVVDSSVESENKLRKYTFTNRLFDGLPTSCQGALNHYQANFLSESVGDYNSFLTSSFCRGFGNYADKEKMIPYVDNVYPSLYSTSPRNEYNVFNMFFAADFGSKQFDRYSGDNNKFSFVTNTSDITYTAPTREGFKFGGMSPRVYSLNVENCLGSSPNNSLKCTAFAPNAFTINDKNLVNTEPRIIANGIYNAKVRFFAFADENHMPIRRVKIDFGDGSEVANENTFGYYKNRKPFCEKDETSGKVGVKHCFVSGGVDDTQLTCQTDADCSGLGSGASCIQINEGQDFSGVSAIPLAMSFGDAPRACSEDYFEFSHVYSCTTHTPGYSTVSTASLTTEEKKILSDMGANVSATTISLCSFTPKVQVLDNWGWCSGICEELGAGSSIRGCYGNLCNTDNRAWVSYGRSILVLPQ